MTDAVTPESETADYGKRRVAWEEWARLMMLSMQAPYRDAFMAGWDAREAMTHAEPPVAGGCVDAN